MAISYKGIIVTQRMTNRSEDTYPQYMHTNTMTVYAQGAKNNGASCAKVGYPTKPVQDPLVEYRKQLYNMIQEVNTLQFLPLKPPS